MNTAVVHDFIDRWGGAESVLQTLLEIYPNATLFTLFADKDLCDAHLPGRKVCTHPTAQRWYSLLKRILPKKYVTKCLLPFFPKWIEEINVNSHDLIISNSGAWCSNIITYLSTCHVVYMHSPMRFAWDWTHAYQKEYPLLRIPNALMLSQTRTWDMVSSKRDKNLVCNARTIQQRIAKYYNKEAQVIYPPVHIKDIPLHDGPRENYFVCIGTLTHYKGFHHIIHAVQAVGGHLTIIGDGPERTYLESISNNHITFLGKVSNEVRNDTISKAQALIQMSEEDFGMVPVEAMAAGTPAICFGKGGATEIIQHGQNGMLFHTQSAESLTLALRDFASIREWDHKYIHESVAHFSKERFIKEFTTYIDDTYKRHQATITT